jgi:hypothetical protein
MKKHRFRASLILSAVLLAACAPGTSPVPPAQPAAVEPSLTPVQDPVDASTLAVDPTATAVPELPAATAPVEALPVATSRGPDLHATDPTTVSLASGGLQLVEFFRFT